MAYSAEVVRRARERLASAKEDRESENQQHLQQAYSRVPRIREIDMLLRRTMAVTARILPVLPYTLAFAAGAMLYVVVEELIPEMSEGEHSNIGTIFFALGFALMMALDVALG